MIVELELPRRLTERERRELHAQMLALLMIERALAANPRGLVELVGPLEIRIAEPKYSAARGIVLPFRKRA